MVERDVFQVRLSEACLGLGAGQVLQLVANAAASSPGVSYVLAPNSLALHTPSGLSVELQVTADTQLKIRRISGDHSQYSQLCHQLIESMTS